MKTLAKAREVNPRDEATLARLAACYYAKQKKDEFQAIIKEAAEEQSEMLHLLHRPGQPA